MAKTNANLGNFELGDTFDPAVRLEIEEEIEGLSGDAPKSFSHLSDDKLYVLWLQYSVI